MLLLCHPNPCVSCTSPWISMDLFCGWMPGFTFCLVQSVKFFYHLGFNFEGQTGATAWMEYSTGTQIWSCILILVWLMAIRWYQVMNCLLCTFVFPVLSLQNAVVSHIVQDCVRTVLSSCENSMTWEQRNGTFHCRLYCVPVALIPQNQKIQISNMYGKFISVGTESKIFLPSRWKGEKMDKHCRYFASSLTGTTHLRMISAPLLCPSPALGVATITQSKASPCNPSLEQEECAPWLRTFTLRLCKDASFGFTGIYEALWSLVLNFLWVCIKMIKFPFLLLIQ